MTFKAYIDNIQAQTGMTPEDFLAAAEKKGLLKEGVRTQQIVKWLKEDYGLGQGHAMAIVLTFKNATQPKTSQSEKIDRLFSGEKANWRAAYDLLLAKVGQFGPDISVDPTDTYVSLLRDGKKFGIVQPTGSRLDIGIKLKNKPAGGRFEAAGTWNAMVSHRVRITAPQQLDAEVLGWLRLAYEKALQVKQKVPA